MNIVSTLITVATALIPIAAFVTLPLYELVRQRAAMRRLDARRHPADDMTTEDIERASPRLLGDVLRSHRRNDHAR